MVDRRFFDLQVNGYGGVDFNSDGLTLEQLRYACERMAQDQVAQFLLTLITDDLAVMERRIHNIVHIRRQDALVSAMLHGIHLEGPFISAEPGYVGAHPAQYAVAANRSAMERLVQAGNGLVRLVTLAPERDPSAAVITWAANQGIVVSAGHTNASLNDLKRAMDAGLSMFTHVGNGCPAIMPRHDNILHRALALSDRLWLCFIADGVHIPPFALALYLRSAAFERVVMVSDAIAAAGNGPGDYTLAGAKVHVDDQLATWSADRTHLMGSACPLRQSVLTVKQLLGISEQDVHRLVWDNPRRAIGLC